MEDAPSLTALILATWQVARVLAVHLIAAVLAERARQPTVWPPGPACGAALRSKGFAPRQRTSLFGPIPWPRRVGRCPRGCAISQVAPLDEALGIPPHQRTSGELQSLGCALAVCVPFATAARLLGWYCRSVVSPRALWCWVQAAGRQAMEHLQEELTAVARGHEPPPEPLTAAPVAVPLVLGADGVMVPLRPDAGAPRGKIRWREVKVGVLARRGPHRTRTGQVVTRLTQRRLVAVLGDIDALKPRLWLAALRQGLRNAPQVVWLRDGGRGLWRLFDECFAGTARGILDFYHAAQNLWKSAAAWLDGRTTQARRWFPWARHRLRHGHPDGVLGDLAEAMVKRKQHIGAFLHKKVDTSSAGMSPMCGLSSIHFRKIFFLRSIEALMPNWFLNPRVHLLTSTIHSQLGNPQESEMEEELAHVLLEAILETGDGSKEHPYLVMRPGDEYDVVEYFGKQVEMQELDMRDERSFDILTCEDGTVYWFDISLLMEACARRESERSAAGA